jgi:hypothetical protein
VRLAPFGASTVPLEVATADRRPLAITDQDKESFGFLLISCPPVKSSQARGLPQVPL